MNMEEEKTSVYVCEGECGAELSEQEYEDHMTKTCEAPDCSRFGEPFVKVAKGNDA